MGENNTFNIKQVFQKGLQYWYLFLIITPLMLGAAYFYLKYAKPVYFAEAMLLIKDDENSGAPTEEIIFTELGLGKKNKTLENETLILKSTPLMSEVVKRLNLNYLYTALDGWKEITLYKNSPVEVVDWRPNQEGLGFDAVMYDNGRGGYKLKIEKQEFSGEFGKELQLPTGKVTLAHKPGQFAYLPIAVTVAPVIDIARQFAGDLKVEIMGDLSSTMHLSLKDHSPDRASDILTKLIEVYNEKSIEVKNRAYENTINMVNERIDMMANNLNQTEQAYEAYKRSNNMVELSAEGTMLMTELASSKKEVTDKLVQLEILSGIEDFLIKNHDNFEFVPTNLNLTNQTLTNQLTSFNELLNKIKSGN